MLTREGSRARLERFRARLESPWDAAVIHLPEHLLYLANFYPLPNGLNLQSSSFLLIERNGPATLYTDNWNAGPIAGDGSWQAHCADAIDVTEWYTCEYPARRRAHEVAVKLQRKLESLKVQTLAAEAAHLPHEVALGARRIADCEPLLRKARELKDADELAAILRGIATAEAMHAASRELLRPGMTELELYSALLERGILAAGCPFVMMCDLASGPRAALGGGAPTSRQIEQGELVILDLFPYVEGYRGDITNTLVAGGRPAAEQADLFQTVLAALRIGEQLLRPGTPVREVYRAIDQHFRKHGATLAHHAGHAIGLGHPEAPEMVPESERRLEAGMVVTLEPGVYGKPAGGIRLEHDYLIKADGCERLSHHELGLT
jgi:Xaa-Pro aminopeptidase